MTQQFLVIHPEKTIVQKRYTHPSVHCSAIYNNQDTETNKMSISGEMDKEDMAHIYTYSGIFSSVQSLSRVRFFATPQTAAHQASLSITSSRSLLKLMSIESVMPSNHLILCRPLLLRPSIFLNIRVTQP